MRKSLPLILLLALACSKKEMPAEPTATVSAPVPVPTATASAAAVAPNTPSIISFSSGALIAVKPAEYSDNWSAFMTLDEDPGTGWATPQGDLTPKTIVIALPAKTELDHLIFDTAAIDGDGRGAKDITAEVSDAGPASGFQKIADVTLADRQDGQTFAVSPAAGRWLRLTVHNNHGSPEYTELMDVRGTGRQVEKPPTMNVSGTYSSDFGDFHVKQEGASVSGCYEHKEGLLTGGVEGRVIKFQWKEDDGGQGPAIMVVSPDGNNLFGLWWHDGEKRPSGQWNGTRKSSDVGGCPHWAGSAAGQLARDLETTGRARVYGINFDSDSDVLRDDSKPTLDQIVDVLKKNADWKMTVEGHTDSTATPEHNQQLSERRAAAVKNYLVTAGIDAARLTSAGFGATKPVGDNSTELGRGQNRRVELAKG
ncbi:MAG TPA: OmpA family protein [Thermoanaerobaculia bacterium]|jgi:outer membrane protein OmpA-like peptidoglycan-associated protein|nr:OmpA family protein [Thermoanaerobaculia bacterium]